MSTPKPRLDTGQLIPSSEAAKNTPYTPDFIRQLARSQKISAVKAGRDWLTTREAILKYFQTQKTRYQKKLAELSAAERSLL